LLGEKKIIKKLAWNQTSKVFGWRMVRLTSVDGLFNWIFNSA